MCRFLTGMESSWAVFVSMLNLTKLKNDSMKVFLTRDYD